MRKRLLGLNLAIILLALVSAWGCKRQHSAPAPDVGVTGEEDDKPSSASGSIIGIVGQDLPPPKQSSVAVAAEENAQDDSDMTRLPIPPDGAALEVRTLRKSMVFLDGEEQTTGQRQFVFKGLEAGKHYQHEIKVQLPDGDLLKRKIILQKGWNVVVPLVARPVDLELAEQTGHSGAIQAAAFSPDARYLLTGADDHTAILWETATGRQLRVFRGHSKAVTAVAFHPNGKQFITGSEDTSIILWDAESGRKLRVFEGHKLPVSAVAFDRDGKRIASGVRGFEGSVILWQVDTAKQLRTIPEPDIYEVAFSPDGKYLLTASRDAATLWLSESGTGIFKVKFESDRFNEISSVAFSPDGKQFLMAAISGKILLREVEGGSEDILTLNGHTNLIDRNIGYTLKVLFSPDGTRILSGCGDGVAILFDRKTGRQINTFPGRREVAFHPGGDQVLTVNGAAATLWDAVSGAPIRVFKGHMSPVSAAVNARGDQFLGGHDDGSTVLWDAPLGERGKVFQGHTTWTTAVAFLPDHRYLLTGSDDKTAVLWDRQTGQPIRTFIGHTAGVTCLAVSPDGKLMATGSADHSVILWETGTGRQVRVIKEFGGGIGAVAFDAGGKELLTASADRTAILWDVASGQKIRTLEGHTDGVTSAVFSRDGKYVLTGSDDKTAILWDRATGEKLRSFLGHSDGVNAVAITADGKYVATGSADKKASLWDRSTGKRLGDFEAHTDSVSSLAFSPDGRRLLTGSWDHRAIIWDVESRRQLSVLAGHSEAVAAAAIRDDGREAATASLDGVAVLWDAVTGRRIRDLHGPSGSAGTVSFRPDGKQVLIAAVGANPTLWDAATALKIREFKADAEAVLSWGHGARFSADNRRLLTIVNRTATVWDVETGKEVSTHTDRLNEISAAAISPDGKQVLTLGSYNGADFELWDAETSETIRTLKNNSKRAYNLAFTPKGDRFVAVHEDGSIALWDILEGHPVRTFVNDEASVSDLAISPDGRWMVHGSSGRGAVLWDLASGEKLREFPGRANSVGFAGNGRYVLTGAGDGAIRLWDSATGDELCRLINIDGGEDWAVVTPEGLFDGTRAGREKVAFRIGDGLDVVPLDRFFQDCYYPALLAEIWRGERPLPGKPLRLSPAPVVKLLVNQNAGETSKNQVWVDVAVTDKGGGIKGPWLQHNGVMLAARETLPKSSNTLRYRYLVTLLGGDNRIEARASTANGGVESEPVVASIKLDGKLPAPDLYAVVIGINRYAKDSGVPDLDCCVADAQAIGELLKVRAGKFYGKVEVTPLVDEQATKVNILKAVTDLSEKARPQDVLVLFIASHGYTVGQRFYLFPHDFRLDRATKPAPGVIEGVAMRGYRGADEQEADVREHGLAIDELGEALARVGALKRVLIFDTCHSGSAVALAGKKLNPFAFRGAMERFSRAQGVYSLAATSADELAAENNAELGHSILTYTLLAAAGAVRTGPLKDEAPRRGSDEAIDVLEWFRYAKERVPVLYQKYVGRRQQIELSGDDQPSFVLLGGK